MKRHAWLLACTTSFAWLDCCVISLFTPWEKTNLKRKRQQSSCLLSDMKRHAWLLAFTTSFAWLVCRVVSLFTPCEQTNVKRKRQRIILSPLRHETAGIYASLLTTVFSNDLFDLSGRRAAFINLFSAIFTRYHSILRF